MPLLYDQKGFYSHKTACNRPFFPPCRFLVSRLAALESSSPQWSMTRTTPSIRNVRWARPHEGSSVEGPSIEMVGKSTEDADSFVFKFL